MPDTLPTFDGRDVLGTAIKVTRAGDGLSKALGVDPRVLHTDEEVYVVLQCKVGAITHSPIKDTNGLQRVHTLIAGTATFVDGAIVSEQIRAQAEKIEMAARLAKGERKFPLPEELRGEHLIGDHAAAMVEGCPLCDEEAAAVKAEEEAYADATKQGVPLASIDGGAQTPKRVRPSRKEQARRREEKAAAAAETGEA